MSSFEKTDGHGIGDGVVHDDIDMDSESLCSTPSSSGSSRSSYATSLQSFTYSNGRRYHSTRFLSGDYFLPNDELEQQRLDFYHHTFLTILGGKLALAPLKEEDVKMVLDVGTGTGIWAIDFAGEYPDAYIIGTDLSPIQPQWVPPNVTFEIADMEDPWDLFYKPNTFDYIHIRTLSGAFKDWDAVLLEAMEYLKPGGYVEFQDYGCEAFHTNGIPENSKFDEYMRRCASAAEKAGRSLLVAQTMKKRMLRLGFDDVQESIHLWPVGPWPKDRKLKEAGRIGQFAMVQSMETFCLDLWTRYEGWHPEQIRQFCAEVIHEMKTVKGYYCEAFVIYGRKPLSRGDTAGTTTNFGYEITMN
ncbi:S-adenosyl-L-methionine-dependent methyltransferase [Kalaharituber pfeilii]|nr:S-adenosyl-L-methionine-dependent methyltransferase [Kalaharituber pfeilii]